MTEANRLLDTVRARLLELAAGDADLLFAFRRKVYKELIYDERDKPMVRRRLKAAKRREQSGISHYARTLYRINTACWTDSLRRRDTLLRIHNSSARIAM
jgi:hypothetical protein